MVGLHSSRILVLGSDGFIGSHLVERLLELGAEVVGWDRRRDRPAPKSRPGWTFRHLDLREDPGQLEEDIRWADRVVNLAAICNPSQYNTRTIDTIESNFLHVEPVVRRCAAHDRYLLHFSTSEVFGRTLGSFLGDGKCLEESFDEHASPFLLGPLGSTRWSYAAAKQLAERLVEAYGRERGLRWSIVRPFNFIGPRMDFLPGLEGEGTPRVLACFLSSLLRRRPLDLVEGGGSRRTFLHVSEAVDGICLILGDPARSSGRVFHLGHPGNETTIRELAERMRALWAMLREDPSVLDLPLREISSRDFYGEGYEDSDRRLPGIDQARSLGWEPRMDLDQALLATMRDYHERFPKDPP